MPGLISGRPRGGGSIGWFRTADPFGAVPAAARPTSPVNSSPLTAYTYADGVLRVLTGDSTISPYGLNRNPLYLWDIDPDSGFAASKRRTVFDIVAAGLPIPVESRPTCDMAKLLPHAGGQEQIIVYRVRCGNTNDPSHTGNSHHTSGERDGRHLLRRGAIRGGLPWSLAVCVRRPDRAAAR